MYEEEAKARWGNTDAYRESQARVVQMGKDGLRAVADGQQALARQIGVSMSEEKPADSSETQALIALHYDGLRHFYEPSLEIYAGLSAMYVEDERFAKYYEDIAPGLAVYMSAAMRVFVERKQGVG